MQVYNNDPILNQNGDPVPYATVTVYLKGTATLATLYSDDGVTAMANPLTADGQGNWYFYAEDGRYYYVASGGTPSITPYTSPEFELFDAIHKPTRMAHMFQGANAGVKIAAAIADLPATGGTVDVRGLEGAQTIAQDIFAGVTKPGTLLLGSANFSTTATQNIPSHWTIQGNWGPTVQSPAVINEGTIFTWAGAINSTVLRYFNVEFTQTEGIAVDCNLVAGCRGILIDSDNAPQGIRTRFQDIAVRNGSILVGIGTSGGAGDFSTAGIEFRNFHFYNPSLAAVRINSQAAIQTSIFEGGYISIPTNNSAADGFDVRDAAGNPGYAAGNFSIRRVSFGVSQIGYTGATIEFSTANNLSGGGALEISGCDFEIPSSDIAASPGGLVRTSNVVTVTTTDVAPAAHDFQNGATVVISGSTSVGGTSFDGAFVITSVTPPDTFTYAQTAADDVGGGGLAATSFALRSTTNDGVTGNIVLSHNTFAISAIYISGTRRVLSIGNSFTYNNAPYFSPATTIARVTSIGDTFGYGRWVVPAAATPLVEINRVSVSGALQPISRISNISNGGTGYLAESALENPIALRLQNTSAAPGNWELTFPGTGGSYPGDFLLYDRINTRNVLVAAQATGDVSLVGKVSATQATSTVATGTAPLVVASTTTVANLTVQRLAKVTNYNAIDTVANGMPAEYAELNLTAQNASIGTTTLYTTVVAGMWRASYYLHTTVAGNAVTCLVTIRWTDTQAAQSISSGTIAINTINDFEAGTFTFYSSAPQNITYATTVSGGAGTGKYALYVRLEAL